MLWYDLLLLLVLFGGLIAGFNLGLVRQALSIVGLIFGLVLASTYHGRLTTLVNRLLGESESLSRDAMLFFVVFALVWVAVIVGTYFSFRTAPRFLPEAPDRLIGMLLGLVTGIVVALVATLLIDYGTEVPWPQWNGVRRFIQSGMEASLLRPVLATMTGALVDTLERFAGDNVIPPFFLNAL